MDNAWFISDKEFLEKIGEKLKFLRKQKKISQTELSSKTGMSRTSISDMEKGKNFTFLSFINYLRAINALNKLDSFLTENETVISPITLHKLQNKRKS